MDNKKYVVYDCRNYFSRFLKYEFRNTNNFESFKDFKIFENVISNYSAIIFVIYSEEELINFIKEQEKIMDDMVRLCLEDFGIISLDFGNGNHNIHNHMNNKINGVKVSENK